jgi:hypothetical protein
MSDHFAHFDRNINIYNFLKFKSWQWQIIDNTIQPQNRLRVDDYRQLFKDVGLSIDEEIARPGNIEELRTIKLDNSFTSKKLEDIAVSHIQLIVKT